jgi:hypothetical protein
MTLAVVLMTDTSIRSGHSVGALDAPSAPRGLETPRLVSRHTTTPEPIRQPRVDRHSPARNPSGTARRKPESCHPSLMTATGLSPSAANPESPRG